MNTDNLQIVNADDFKLDLITPLHVQRGYKAKGPRYYDILMAFDIEVTYLPDLDQSIMYIWQWAFNENLVVIGRTWNQFKKVLTALKPLPYMFVCYVHNLSYEFQFLAGVISFDTEDVFAVKSRKILKAKFQNIEFRCSYLHSNMGLDKFIKFTGGAFKKLELDYNIIRYPWTPLSDKELRYCINDVIGLVSAIRAEMRRDVDNLYTIPLTSTGYLRREAKESLRPKRKQIRAMMCDYDTQQFLRRAFRGGDTHASRFYTGFIVKDVQSIDRSSSYPDVMVNDVFPVSGFTYIGHMSIAMLEDMLSYNALLLDVCFYKISLYTELEACPYISLSKCDVFVQPLCDNGRIMSADYIETVITDVDFQIIRDCYKWESIVIRRAWAAPYGFLPEELRDLNRDYYRKKTTLKGSADPDAAYYYTKAKNKLNSCYGMCAQNPAKDHTEFHANVEHNGGFINIPFTENDWKDKAKSYWLHYAWGVWVTAWARFRLWEGRKIIAAQTHNIGWVYGDTDSLKYMGSVDFSAYNEERIRHSKQNGAYAVDAAGVTHYMGVFEPEAPAAEFRTWGAKKYAYRDTDGHLHVTVSGVSKAAGALELEKAGGLAAFKPGFVFRDAGGSELKYDDTINQIVQIDGHDLHITRNVSIKPSTYKMSITSEYEEAIRYDSIAGEAYLDYKW